MSKQLCAVCYMYVQECGRRIFVRMRGFFFSHADFPF